MKYLISWNKIMEQKIPDGAVTAAIQFVQAIDAYQPVRTFRRHQKWNIEKNDEKAKPKWTISPDNVR